MRRRRGWSAIEMILASAIASSVLLASGTLWATFSRRTARDATRAALLQQANSYADMIEHAVRNAPNVELITRNGQQMLVVKYYHSLQPNASNLPNVASSDPSGVLSYDPGYNAVFFLADATFAPANNGSPMMAYVLGDPLTQPLGNYNSRFRDLDGRSFFPAIRSQTFSVDATNQSVTFTITASSRDASFGGQVSASGAGATQVTVSRTVGWRYGS